jgi:dihydropteroate synthase
VTSDLGVTRIGSREFRWGARTYVMGIVNVTPDSFSGDGLLAALGDRRPDALDPAVVELAVAQGRAMVADGADLLDVGGESTRPGHTDVSDEEEHARVVPIVSALRRALPDTLISIDTTKAPVAAAALDAGADLINDIWGVASRSDLVDLAAARRVPIVLMHNRAVAEYTDLMAEVVAELEGAIDRAVAAGVPRTDVIVDPGFGFGKTALHNLEVLRSLGALRVLGRPILLGTSRKSTLGKILDLPASDRVEATVATTAIGIANGVDMIRVHDVRENVRAARVSDAIVRGTADDLLARPTP